MESLAEPEPEASSQMEMGQSVSYDRVSGHPRSRSGFLPTTEVDLARGSIAATQETQAMQHNHSRGLVMHLERNELEGRFSTRYRSENMAEFEPIVLDSFSNPRGVGSPFSGISEMPSNRTPDAPLDQVSLRVDHGSQRNSPSSSLLLSTSTPLLISTLRRQLPLQDCHNDYVQDWIKEHLPEEAHNRLQSNIPSTNSSSDDSDQFSQESSVGSPIDQRLPAEDHLASSSAFRVTNMQDLTEGRELPTESYSHPQRVRHHRHSKSVDSRTVSDSGSGISSPSATSNVSRSGKRGKRQSSQHTPNEPYVRDGASYHCTWCRRSFKKPSDWRRHEESQHAPQNEFVCLAEGMQAICCTRDGEQKFCAMCWHPDPRPDHSSTCRKNISRCMNKPEKDRTFDRKDHLAQHLKRCHHVNLSTRAPVNFSQWKRPLNTKDTAPLWDCGLCDERGMDWDTRYQHVMEHVKNQFNLTYWRKCVCTQGYSPNLQNSLNRLGFGAIFAQKCRPLWFCPLEDLKIGPSGPSGQAPMYLSALSAQGHWRLKHPERDDLHPYSRCIRGFKSPIQAVGIPFWCGFCGSVVQSSEAGSYDCLIMHHIDRRHIMEGDSCQSWKPMDPGDLNDFITSLKSCEGLPTPLPREILTYYLNELQSPHSALRLPISQMALALAME